MAKTQNTGTETQALKPEDQKNTGQTEVAKAEPKETTEKVENPITPEEAFKPAPTPPAASTPAAPAPEVKKEPVYTATMELRFREKDVELEDGAFRKLIVLQQRFEHSDPEKNAQWRDVPLFKEKSESGE